MNLNSIRKNVIRQIQTTGLSKTIHSLLLRLNTRLQERRLGIQTEAFIELSELGIYNPECKYYSPTEYAGFRRIIRGLHINPADHVFLDFGAGMGRAMILAAGYPFRRVLGIEISPELVHQAEENFARCKSKLKCPNLQIVTGDASAYAIPPDVTLAYFYNPFFGEILSSVLANLHASVLATPREVMVICNLPRDSVFESEIGRDNQLFLKDRFAINDCRVCLICSTVPPHFSFANRR